ncbi:MAG: O-acetyl-ADP-ribose deacetylase [bacterium]
MKMKIGSATLELAQGDITHESTDAIANAANTSLLGGGGVDGAIHRAGGPAILKECEKLGGCATGDAKITTGGNLKARHVIHTVGPVYRDGSRGEPDLLASCYRRCLEVARENGVESIAFPSISTGVYGYPVDDAAQVALTTIKRELTEHGGIELVRFVLFDKRTFDAYAGVLEGLGG